MIERQKELYQRRGMVATGILLFFFLLFSLALYEGLDSIFNYHDPSLSLEYPSPPLPPEAIYNLTNFLAFTFLVTILIMLVGLWYLKKWAAWGLTIAYGFGAFIVPFAEPSFSQSFLPTLLMGFLNLACVLAILWGVFLGWYWERLE